MCEHVTHSCDKEVLLLCSENPLLTHTFLLTRKISCTQQSLLFRFLVTIPGLIQALLSNRIRLAHQFIVPCRRAMKLVCLLNHYLSALRKSNLQQGNHHNCPAKIQPRLLTAHPNIPLQPRHQYPPLSQKVQITPKVRFWKPWNSSWKSTFLVIYKVQSKISNKKSTYNWR